MTEKNKLCFVIGPIGAYKSPVRTHADILLTKIIKPVFRTHFKTFHVERADHIPGPGLMDSQIISRLIDAELVIADLTDRNANAFYELGIRHMLIKPVIHLFRRGSVIPADVAPYRAIEFSYEETREITLAKQALRRMVTQALSLEAEVETPVTRSAAYIRAQNKPPATVAPQRHRRGWERVQAPVLINNAPGITWRKYKKQHRISWVAPRDAVKKGYRPVGEVRLWSGPLSELDTIARDFVSDRANSMQNDMLLWSKGESK